jgi:SAM-dependent methyltransferase
MPSSSQDSASFLYSGDELEAMAAARNYYAWIARRFAPFLGERVLEAGAGTGTFSQVLLATGQVKRLVALEPAANTYPLLARTFAGDQRVTAMQGYLGAVELAEQVDSLVAVNVLEHVLDDTGFLQTARAAVKPGGHLLLFVPALPAIFGSLDEAFEHHRRYTRVSMSKLLANTGWQVISVRYTNLPGVLSWFIAGRILRQRTLDSRSVSLYDRLIVPPVAWIETLLPPPIGQSLLVIARNPDTRDTTSGPGTA